MASDSHNAWNIVENNPRPVEEQHSSMAYLEDDNRYPYDNNPHFRTQDADRFTFPYPSKFFSTQGMRLEDFGNVTWDQQHWWIDRVAPNTGLTARLVVPSQGFMITNQDGVPLGGGLDPGILPIGRGRLPMFMPPPDLGVDYESGGSSMSTPVRSRSPSLSGISGLFPPSSAGTSSSGTSSSGTPPPPPPPDPRAPAPRKRSRYPKIVKHPLPIATEDVPMHSDDEDVDHTGKPGDPPEDPDGGRIKIGKKTDMIDVPMDSDDEKKSEFDFTGGSGGPPDSPNRGRIKIIERGPSPDELIAILKPLLETLFKNQEGKMDSKLENLSREIKNRISTLETALEGKIEQVRKSYAELQSLIKNFPNKETLEDPLRAIFDVIRDLAAIEPLKKENAALHAGKLNLEYEIARQRKELLDEGNTIINGLKEQIQNIEHEYKEIIQQLKEQLNQNQLSKSDYERLRRAHYAERKVLLKRLQVSTVEHAKNIAEQARFLRQQAIEARRRVYQRSDDVQYMGESKLSTDPPSIVITPEVQYMGESKVSADPPSIVIPPEVQFLREEIDLTREEEKNVTIQAKDKSAHSEDRKELFHLLKLHLAGKTTEQEIINFYNFLQKHQSDILPLVYGKILPDLVFEFTKLYRRVVRGEEKAEEKDEKRDSPVQPIAFPDDPQDEPNANGPNAGNFGDPPPLEDPSNPIAPNVNGNIGLDRPPPLEDLAALNAEYRHAVIARLTAVDLDNVSDDEVEELVIYLRKNFKLIRNIIRGSAPLVEKYNRLVSRYNFEVEIEKRMEVLSVSRF
jgi:hypothetical protein